MYAQAFRKARQQQRSQRRGAVIVLAVLLMAIMLGMVAYGVDIGYILSTKTELRRAVDAGTLAAPESSSRACQRRKRWSSNS